MARIRTIKPEFWTDGDVIAMSPHARLLFIGMWNFALCDYGHLPDDPMRIKLQILPMDDVDITKLLDEVISSGRIKRCETSVGRSYLWVVRLAEHQKIERRWQPRCYVCADQRPDNLPEPPRTSPNLPRALPNTPNLPLVREGKGREGLSTPSTTAPRSTHTYPADFVLFWEQYPKKVGKDAALKAWKSAVKRASVEEIVTGAKRYANDPQREAKFTKDPQGWLSGGHWADEPTSPTHTQRRYFGKPGERKSYY